VKFGGLTQTTIACSTRRISCILLPKCRWVANQKACSDNRSHLRELNGGCFNLPRRPTGPEESGP
jgi:hypothetical protein